MGGRRRTKGTGRHSAQAWARAAVGLEQYDNDIDGVFRNWMGSGEEWMFHRAHNHPSYPLMGKPMFWQFLKTDDIDGNAWTITEGGTGTQLALQDDDGGVAKFTNGAADNNYQQYFSKSEIVQIGSAAVVVARFRIKVADVDQADMFVGLCEKLASGNIFDNRVNCIGFYLGDGLSSIHGVTTKAGAALATGLATISDDTWVDLGLNIICDPGAGTKRINYFVDYVQKETHDTSEGDRCPTNAMCLAFGLRNGQASANSFSISTPAYVLKD